MNLRLERDIDDITNALDIAFDTMPKKSVKEDKRAWERLKKLARLGAAIESLPAKTALMKSEERDGTWFVLEFKKFKSRTWDYIMQYVPTTEEKTPQQALDSLVKWLAKRGGG